MQYTTIGFDYGGVIFGQPGTTIRQIADFFDIPIDVLRKKFFEHNHRANVEKMAWNDLWCLIFDELGYASKQKSLVDFIERMEKEKVVNQEVITLIRRLRIAGFKIGLLSNYAMGLRELLDQQGIANEFDVIGISSEIGAMKPHKEAFERFCTTIGCLPQELVFIDDSRKSLEYANEIGFVPILFTGYEPLCNDLKRLGVL